MNHAPCKVLGYDGKYKMVMTGDIKVGDILVLQSKDQIAADCILLSSADKNGQCFV